MLLSVSSAVPVSLIVVDTAMTIVAASQTWADRYGVPAAQMLGKNLYAVRPVSAEWREIHSRCMAGAIEKRVRDAMVMDDGTEQVVKWEVRPWMHLDGKIGGIVIQSEVITEYVLEERKYQQLFRDLNLLMDITKLIFDQAVFMDEFDLIENACKKIVDFGGYGLAWFAYGPEATATKKTLKLVHKYGPAIHYLDEFEIDLDNEVHRNGPSATAIITGSPTVVNDIPSSRLYNPWLRSAVRNHLQSSVSIPVDLGHGQRGIIVVYSSEKEAFGEEEVAIFTRISVALSYSILAQRADQEHKIALLKMDKVVKDLNSRNRNLESFSDLVSHTLRSKVASLVGIAELIDDEMVQDSEKTEMVKNMGFLARSLDESMKDLNSTLLVRNHLVLNHDIIELEQKFIDVLFKLDLVFPGRKSTVTTDFAHARFVRADRYYLFEATFQLLQCLVRHETKEVTHEIKVNSHVSGGYVTIYFHDTILGVKMLDCEYAIFDIYRKYYQHYNTGGIKLFYVGAILEVLGGKFSAETIEPCSVVFSMQLPVA